MGKKISAFAKANDRIKKLETIIGKMVVDAHVWPDMDMLYPDEEKLVDEVSDKYMAETHTGVEPCQVHHIYKTGGEM